LSEWLVERGETAANAIHALARDRLLGTPEADLIEWAYDHFAVEPLKLGEPYTPGPQDVQVDVGGQFLRGTEHKRGVYVRGTRLELHIPFTGDPSLWDLRASSGTTVLPRGDVRGNEVIITLEEPADTLTPEMFRDQTTSQLRDLGRYVEFSATDCEGFNRGLRPMLSHALAARKEKVLADKKVTEFLPVAVRPRPSSDPATAVALPPRRRPPGTLAAPTTPYVAEPAISAQQYTDILHAIRSWGLAVERLPGTFSPMPEEALRDNLLVTLNSQFGASGAEWFSRKGKTDILIQQADGAVFIAECKFWSGSGAFVEGIDQLLGYLVWRDTKSALVLFVREGDVSSIIGKADEAIKRHARYKRTTTGGLHLLRQEQDANREIEVAIIVVPVSRPKQGEALGKTPGTGRRRAARSA